MTAQATGLSPAAALPRTSTPPFSIDGTVFHCLVVADGLNEIGIPATRYEWQTADGRAKAGRTSGQQAYWASADGRNLGADFHTLKRAMEAAADRIARGSSRGAQSSEGVNQ